MSITYFCTDSRGHTYRRFSAKHTEARYRAAAISRKPGNIGPVGKAGVSYSSGTPTRRDDYEVVPVRAYQGRHESEPSAKA